MKHQFRMKYIATALTATVLAACSGSSDTLKVRESSTTNKNYSRCTGTCVKTEFTLEPIRNVNYSCANVNNVTGVASLMICPPDSEMKVFIQNPGGKRKVELGRLRVDAISKNRNAGKFLQRVSPIELVENELNANSKNKVNITSLNSADALPAINMIRLLDALGDRTVPYNDYAPVNQISIDDKYKANMDELLKSDVTINDFKSDAFISKTRAWLASHDKRVTLSVADARQRLARSLNVLNGGVYYQIPTLTGASLGTAERIQFGRGISISGRTNNKQEAVNMAIFAQANREGATFGQGMHWQGPAQTNVTAFNLFRAQPFKKMRLNAPANAKFDVLTDNIKGYDWSLYTLDDKGAESKANIDVSMNQGKLFKNFVMIGTAELYNTYFGTTLPDSDKDSLGKWSQTDQGVGGVSAEGQATILKYTESTLLSTFFDPQVWRSKHVVKKGQHYVFPLHATLNFTYGKGNKDAPDCKDRETGCDFTQGKLGITILENGDIITDGSGVAQSGFAMGAPNCQAVSLKQGMYTDTSGKSEKRIGTIRATSAQVAGQSGKFINPSIILSGAEFGELDGIHLGSRVSSPLVTINVGPTVLAAASLDQGNKLTASIIMRNVSGSILTDASWVNPYHFYTQLNTNYKKETETNYQLTPLQTKAQQQISGNATLALSECYTLNKRS